jgi:hypothetical protein
VKEQELIEEAIKRGLVSGTVIELLGKTGELYDGFFSYSYSNLNREVLWHGIKGGIYGESTEIFVDGQWAEIKSKLWKNDHYEKK